MEGFLGDDVTPFHNSVGAFRIVFQERSSGFMYIYNPKYPAQRSMFEQKRTERLIAAIEELKHVGNINIFLFKKGCLRKFAERKM